MHCPDCSGIGAQVAEQFLTCTKPIFRPVATEPPVRRLLCSTCDAAHRAHAACCPQNAQVVRTS
ncbi:hypothetical protein QQY66_23170 [Streptomyces sp. DG2A-72]|uniref:hypothetical protein n=1 Tax=Streptomyces sp. DG2A-72 TaxID=3051386 RepID=UPI00265C250E|nr:hypothetical protein [Streptomyces sp. DG2A-72]MDO0934436.1 hypothetical protein [Streptomyces sp. DG2A-72]